MSGDRSQRPVNQAALRGRPAARRARAADSGPFTNRDSGTTTDAVGAPRVRSARVRMTRLWLRSKVTRGIGAEPVSSQRWHHTTNATDAARMTPTIAGSDSHRAPASSTNISVPLGDENGLRPRPVIAFEAIQPSQFSCALDPLSVAYVTHYVCQISRVGECQDFQIGRLRESNV